MTQAKEGGMDITKCPDPSTLDRLLSGLIPDEVAVDIEEHLLGCKQCCEQARELATTGSTENVATARAAAELSKDPAVIDVAERVATLRLPAHGRTNTETVVVGADTTTDAWDVAQILDPPVSEGEIGHFGGYRVLRLLGAGGMGLVWEAEDPQLCRRVALKVMKPALAGQREYRERFLREARAVAAIDHSHIVTIYQVGEHRGLPFLAMQLLRGETLDDTLRREARLPQSECLRIGRQMADALAVAHRRRVVHRDIKPTNTWLETDGGWVKLVDFGLAQIVADESHVTQTGVIIGTPAYMSPEQARGDAVDARSDLFSLGAVLYRMTTGVGPFEGANTLAVLTSLALRVPEPPHQIRPEIWPVFSDLIMRLLAKDPTDRPASAEAVVEAIREIEASASSKVTPTHLGGEIVAIGASPTSRGRGHAFRPRRWVLVAAACALFLAAIIVIIRNRHSEKVGGIRPGNDHQAETVQRDVAAEPPAAIAEPAELEEWLRGRTILTVSQDGSGQFRTIQAAIDALQPGQAVEVLDRGPYRETLLVAGLRDVGLFSRAGTVIEPGGKRRVYRERDTADYHCFSGTGRFRLSGLSFIADDPQRIGTDGWWIDVVMSGDVLVEHCHFAGGRPGMHELFIGWYPEIQGTVCHVRECLFDMGPHLTIFEGNSGAVAIVEHNWFRTTPPDTSLTIDGPGDRVVIRHNLFDDKQQRALHLWKIAGIGRVEIYNNTMMGRILARDKPSTTGVIIRNNLFREGLVMDGEGSQAALEGAVKGWQVGNNEYARTPGGANQFPRTASDFIGQPKFLSRDSTDVNYLRIASDSDEARRGTGGAWPNYLGALPPGPAPEQGDWLTRWIERSSARVAPTLRNGDGRAPPSQSAEAVSRPPDVPDPPPLDEWLKGRTILTVSQDGNGQFKNIQAAIDACLPGEVVEILDRGPYRETLYVAGTKDSGLFSRAGTVMEPGGKRIAYHEGDAADHHSFSGVERFRLSGLSFVADDLRPVKSRGWWIQFGMYADILVESCRFVARRPGMHELYIWWYATIPGTVFHVRECLFETAPHVTIWERSSRAVVIIERNWFRKMPPGTELTVQGPAERVLIRHNIFDGDDQRALRLWKTDGLGRLEIYNNTMGGRILVEEKPSETGVTVINNLFREGITMDGEGGQVALEAAIKGWQVRNNEYAEAPERPDEFPRTAADFVGLPKFLSRDSTDANYLRIASDSDESRRGASGKWPSYLGALPPGPAPAGGDWLTRWIDRNQSAARD